MPPRSWPTSRDSAVNAIEAHVRAGGATQKEIGHSSSLIAWAIGSVDTLHYLRTVDQTASGNVPLGHARDIVDVAHVRAATGAAITALDLCAAILGRVALRNSGDFEKDLEHFNPRSRNSNGKKNHAQLSGNAQAWVDAVLADPEYALMKAIRNPMTHAYWKSRVMWVATPAGPRTGFVAGTVELTPTAIIDRAIAMAEQHVDAFLAGIVAGTLP